MDLREFDGKQLFAGHGIPIPERVVVTDTAKAVELPETEQVVVKAQVPVGKREEHGGIKIVPRDEALDVAEEMLGTEICGELVELAILEEYIDIADELYVSLSINRAGKGYHLVFSEQGGTGIESVADADPDAIHTYDFYEFDPDTMQDELDDIEHRDDIVAMVEQMYDVLRDEDALLVEINPLVVTTDGDLMATDAKVRIDDDALYRHEFDFATSGDAQRGMEFVPLDGNIAVIGNGAGLVMATLDSITHFGGRPADFLDIGGGADMETMTDAMRVAMNQEHVDGLFVNIFGGITRCDEVADGIITFVDDHDLDIPLVVRMVGTNQQEGRQMLEDSGIHALDSMAACAEKITELAEADN